MNFAVNARGGQTTYDIRHDTQVAGEHRVHVSIHGTPIKGSPMSFRVHPDKADPPNCKLSAPSGGNIHAHEQGRFLVLKTYDRFNNEVDVGGLVPTCRLMLIKQGVHDQTNLMPNNHKVEVEDLDNGTYHINVWFAMPCVCKLICNLDKNMPTNIAELAPITLHCVDDPKASVEVEPVPELKKSATKTDLNSPGSGSNTPKGGSGSFSKKAGEKRDNTKLKNAAAEMMMGFGAADERRDKDAIIVAAEAFADGAEGFTFDKPTGESLSKEVKKQAQNAKKGSLMKGLFDRT